MTRAFHSQSYDLEEVEVTIASSGTVSTAANLLGMRLVGIVTPAALTGTAFTFKKAFAAPDRAQDVSDVAEACPAE